MIPAHQKYTYTFGWSKGYVIVSPFLYCLMTKSKTILLLPDQKKIVFTKILTTYQKKINKILLNLIPMKLKYKLKAMSPSTMLLILIQKEKHLASHRKLKTSL